MNSCLKKSRILSLTLIELLISVTLLSAIILAISNIDLFGRFHTISAERRVKLQNEISSTLDHMSKNIMQGIGGVSNPALELITGGFRVRVDWNNPSTPQNLSDDTWVEYTLSGNTLSCNLNNETISTHIVPGVVIGTMPSNPTSGFYINLTDNNTVVEVGLVARWQPTVASSADNPQVTMTSRMFTRSSAAR